MSRREQSRGEARVRRACAQTPYSGATAVREKLPNGETELTLDHVADWLEALVPVLSQAVNDQQHARDALAELHRDVAGMRRLMGLK